MTAGRSTVVTGDESLAARRVTLLEWLARGRDIRLAAELSGETRDWATATAVAAGHPHLDKVREALAEARRALAEERATPVRQAPARAVVQRPAPVRPIRESLPEHVAAYASCDEGESTGRNCALHGGRPGVSAYLAPDGEPAPAAANLHHVDPSAIPSALAAAATREQVQTAALMAMNDRLPEPHLHTFVEGRDGVGGYAHCAGCGTTWRSVPCEVCRVTVAAAHIARTGRARHTWHPVIPEPTS